MMSFGLFSQLVGWLLWLFWLKKKKDLFCNKLRGRKEAVRKESSGRSKYVEGRLLRKQERIRLRMEHEGKTMY